MADGKRLGTHPDENLLTAFAEHALTSRERQSVLEHLSGCARCRDAIFLAQGARSDLDLPAEQPQRVSAATRVSWRRLRWGTLVAGGILAVLLVTIPVLVYWHKNHRSQRATRQTASGAPVDSSAARSVQPLASPPALSPTLQKPSTTGLAKTNGGSSSDDFNGQAEIAGSVADQSGAVIPGASVKVRPVSSGKTHMAVTNAQGQFEVTGLPSGTYQVEVAASGFNNVTRELTVHPHDHATFSTTLAVGAASQAVEVTAANGGVGTGRGSGVGGGATDAGSRTVAGGQVANGLVSNLPLNGRNVAPLPLDSATEAVMVSPAAAPLKTTSAEVSAILPSVASTAATFRMKDGVVQCCVGTECAPRKLPSAAPAIFAAFDVRTVLALDSDGNLFMSNDQGDHWEKVKAQWVGKASSLQAIQSHQLEMFTKKQPTSHVRAGTSYGGPVSAEHAQAPSVDRAIFELTNDKGQVWLSSDEGKTWLIR
jgi:hypothetical protein